MEGCLAQGLSYEVGGFPMIVLFLNEGPPVGFGVCRKGTLLGEGGGNPSESGWRLGAEAKVIFL